tara:strand:+ start:39 stop:701 length:663 start_codon:yes stop_codon:yes gene_type:complete
VDGAEMENRMNYDFYNVFVRQEFSSLMGNIDTIFELGARNGLYTREIQHHYQPKQIFSFECNPSSIDRCKNNISDVKTASFHSVAVADYTGSIDFFQADDCGNANDGSSSIFSLSKLNMKKVTVDCITLDDFCRAEEITEIDLICADIEGAEVRAFTDQQILHNTRYIITEVQINPHWKPECLTIVDLENVICEYGFEKAAYIDGCGCAGDALYINRNIL